MMQLILDKKKICLGLGHEQLGFKSLFCQMHPAKPSRHNHLELSPCEKKHLGRAEMRQGKENEGGGAFHGYAGIQEVKESAES